MNHQLRDQLVARLWRGHEPFSSATEAAPVDRQGWHTSQHHFLLDAIKKTQPKLIIELGVWKGASTLYMARTLADHRIDGLVLAVDTWLGSAEHWISEEWFPSLRIKGGRPTIYDTFAANVIESGLANFILPFPLDSKGAAEVLSHLGLKADVIHIDAAHDKASVAADLEAWWPLLRNGGALVGDDYYDAGEWPGVKEAFDEFVSQHRLNIHKSNGKCLIYKEEAPPPGKSTGSTIGGQGQAIAAASQPLYPSGLPETLEYTGEFGAEIILFMPFIHWLSAAGLLGDRTVVTYAGMAPLYNRIGCSNVVEKDDIEREHVPAPERPSFLPIKDEWSFDGKWTSPLLLYPDFRRIYYPRAREVLMRVLGDKPICIVHNKFNREFGFTNAVNYIPVPDLDWLFASLSTKFTVCYIRHGIVGHRSGYARDHNVDLEFPDLDVVKAYKNIIVFEDLLTKAGAAYNINELKMMLYSLCYNFITVQGGGAHQIACFSGSLLSILHRYGPELKSAYDTGFYNFASNPSPTRLVCLNTEELRESACLHLNSVIVDRKALVAAEHAEIVSRLSPAAQRAEMERRPNDQLINAAS